MRPEKISVVDEFRKKVGDSTFVILAAYRGLNVAKMTELRRRLGGVQAQLQVVQNRLFQRALKDTRLRALEGKLDGPSAMIFGRGDVVQAAKVLKEFIRENELPVIRVGALGEAVLSAEDIERLAGLPSREALLGLLVGTVAAPLSRLVGVLQQKVASVVYVLKAVQEKKEKAG